MKMFVKVDNNTYKCDCGKNNFTLTYKEGSGEQITKQIHRIVYLSRTNTPGSVLAVSFNSRDWFNLYDYPSSELDNAASLFNEQIAEQLKQIYKVDGLKYQQASREFDSIND
jgi:hypothetical protein